MLVLIGREKVQLLMNPKICAGCVKVVTSDQVCKCADMGADKDLQLSRNNHLWLG